MDLQFSQEQEMLRDTVRALLVEHSSLDDVRAFEDDPAGFKPELWAQFGELGLAGLMLPEAYGGSGMGPVEGAIVYEELGRALAASPHFVSAICSAAALLRAGSEEQKTEWLPKLASTAAIFTPAWLERGNGFGPEGVQMRAVGDGDGCLLSGEKCHVAYASSADRLLVLARNDDGAVDLLLVDPAAGGVSMEQRLTMGSEAQYLVAFDGVRVGDDQRVGPAGSGWETWAAVMHEAVVLLAAQASGGCQRALEITVEYSMDRHQFDKPLAAFQAISHYLADAQTLVDGATTLAYEAAWTQEQGRSAAKLAPMAKLFACNTYRDVTAMATQVHGGMGFTIEYDIQLFFRRAKQLQLTWWDTRYLEDLIAAAVLDGPGAEAA